MSSWCYFLNINHSVDQQYSWCSQTMTTQLCPKIFSVLIVWFSFLIFVDGHARLLEPPARNVLWRLKPDLSPIYDDSQLFCGGFGVSLWKTMKFHTLIQKMIFKWSKQVQHVENQGKCGVCGDSYAEPHKWFEKRGFACNNFTTRAYSPRSRLDVIVDVLTNHGGKFSFQICYRNSFNQQGKLIEANLVWDVFHFYHSVSFFLDLQRKKSVLYPFISSITEKNLF